MTDRQIFADTETTGLDEKSGRVIEVGLVEYWNRKPTGVVFHVYLNPEMEIDQAATNIHGLTWDHLKDQPLFSDVAADMLDFIGDSEILFHNADFDVKFIDKELERLGRPERLRSLTQVTDTLALSRQKLPGQRLSLDSLCDKFGVNRSHRDFHGALLDASLLAEVYVAMTSGQNKLDLGGGETGARTTFADLLGPPPEGAQLLVSAPTDEEMKRHLEKMAEIQKKAGRPVWDGPAM